MKKLNLFKNRQLRLLPGICSLLFLAMLTVQAARGQGLSYITTPDGKPATATGGTLLTTPYPPGEINGANGSTLVFMPHNLGADTSLNPFVHVDNGLTVDNDIKGYLYQWGRPTDGHQYRSSVTTTVLSSSDVPGHGDFIISGNSPYDWRSPQNNALWGSTKTANDPCPVGYRVPTSAEWLEARDNNIWTWTGNGYAIDANSDGSPELYLPEGGYRNNTNGAFVNSNAGYYWSSTINGTSAYSFIFSSGGLSVSSFVRAKNASVRCVAE